MTVPAPGVHATFDRHTVEEIHRAAETGVYAVREGGCGRALPHFDDLLFLGASMSRYPLEGYHERCRTDVVLGDRHATRPLQLDTPITVASMGIGVLPEAAEEALGIGADAVGTSTTAAGSGTDAQGRKRSRYLVHQYLPSRYGTDPDSLRRADAVEIVLGQGAEPGGGGLLLGRPITDRTASAVGLPAGVDRRSPCRHPDWTGPDDLAVKILELREITCWEKPVYIKVGATRTYYDVKLAVQAGADVVVVDGMQGGTSASQAAFVEHVGIPTLAAIPQAVQALQELGVHRRPGGVQLIVSGGIRSGADVAKAIALGADAVSIGTAALIAIGGGDFDREHPGSSTSLDPVDGGRRLANYLRALTTEARTLARACGKSHLRNLEPEDLVALTVEAAAMARVPLAGTNWIPGREP